MLRLIMIVGVAVSSACVAGAEEASSTFRQLAQECIQIRDNAGNGFEGRALARPIAIQLEALAKEANQFNSLGELGPVLNGEAAECVSYARQLPAGVEFKPAQNRYVTASKVRLSEEEKRLNAMMADVQERREQQEALEREVNARVARACKDLANRDPIAAFTNFLCVTSFKAYGLPEE